MSIESLASTCEENIPAMIVDPENGISEEIEIAGTSVSSISICRLIVASNAVKFYVSVGRIMTNSNMYYTNVLQDFKLEHEGYSTLKI